MGYLDSTFPLLGQDLPPSVRRVQDGRHLRRRVQGEDPLLLLLYDEENEAEEFIREQDSGRRRSSSSARAIRIGRASSSTTARSTASGSCGSWGMRRSSPTTTRRPSRPTSTPATGSTSTPLPEDVRNLIETEKPYGVVVQSAADGHQADQIPRQARVNILGTSADAIDEAEDRERV